MLLMMIYAKLCIFCNISPDVVEVLQKLQRNCIFLRAKIFEQKMIHNSTINFTLSKIPYLDQNVHTDRISIIIMIMSIQNMRCKHKIDLVITEFMMLIDFAITASIFL